MTTRSAIRYASNGDVSIAYMEGGSGIDLLVIGGFVSHLEIFPTLPAAQRFWDRMGSLRGGSCSTSAGWGSRPGRRRVHAGGTLWTTPWLSSMPWMSLRRRSSASPKVDRRRRCWLPHIPTA